MRHTEILILTVPHGTAHVRLGATLKKAIETIQPKIRVEAINALDHCSRWFRAYYNSYQVPLKYCPALWEWIESYQHTHAATGPGWIYRRAAARLAQLIQALNPQVVVATEVGLCELAALIKKHEALNFRLVAVPTGIDTDLPWVQPEVDLYIVEPHRVAPFFESMGISSSKILAFGVPVDPAFGSFTNPAEMREGLGLIPNLPVLLILFGGSGIGKPLRMIAGLERAQSPFQAVWITGRNASLAQKLKRQLATRNHSHVLGWTDRMPEWMAAADLLLSKPGSATLIEAMNSGLPFLAFDPLPGIERRSCELIETWQIGRWIKHPQELGAAIDDFFMHPGKLRTFRTNALNKVRPRAAQRAAQSILRLLRSEPGDREMQSRIPDVIESSKP